MFDYSSVRCWLKLTLLVFCCLSLGACGKKASPKPITATAPPQIRDLQAQVRPGAVQVMWSFPESAPDSREESEYRFSVRRAEIRWEDRNCPECPAPSPQEITIIDPAHPEGPAVVQGGKVTWLDMGVTVDRAYRYGVTIVDRKGRDLSISNPAVVKVFPPPTAPQELRAIPERQGITLRWQMPREYQKRRPYGEALQFSLERRSPSGTWETVSPVPIAGTAFLDSAVLPNQTYDYRVTPLLTVEGVSVLGESATTERVEALEAVSPSPPNTVWVIPSQGSLEVQWTESEAKVGGYHVYRRDGQEIVRLTANPVVRPPFVDRNVSPNAIYHYAVSAVGANPPHREGLLSKWVEIRNVVFP